MKVVVTFFLMICLVLCINNGCRPQRYVVVDSAAKDVQEIVAKVNQGIGEGRYDTVLLIHGKDPILSASCVVSTNEWRVIVSNGEQQNATPIMELKSIVSDSKILNCLGCYRVRTIDCYGYIQDNGDVRLIIENYGDANGKFPEEFWEKIAGNVK